MEELYDLSHDSREQSNIANDRPQARLALRGVLDRVAAEARIQPPAAISAEARERLQALGYVGAHPDASTVPGDTLADPKDKRQILEQYRAAVDLAGQRQWPQAIAILHKILNDDAGMVDVWSQLAVFAMQIDRYDQALDAYKHLIELTPQDSSPYIGAAAALLKLRKPDDAREHALLAVEIAARDDHHARAAAHEMLSRIALSKHDLDAARSEAASARQEDPTLPLPDYVDARILYDQGKYDEALPLFEKASAESRKSGSVQIAELHYYTGDTLARVERYAQAQAEFNEELRTFPQNVRARGGLAMVYQANGEPDAAERTLTEMLRVAPDYFGYALASRCSRCSATENGPTSSDPRRC